MSCTLTPQLPQGAGSGKGENLYDSSDRVKALVAVDGARILGAPKECNEDKTGGGILHSISQLEKPSHLEAFITQADNLQGADNEFWQNIAGVLRRLQ